MRAARAATSGRAAGWLLVGVALACSEGSHRLSELPPAIGVEATTPLDAPVIDALDTAVQRQVADLRSRLATAGESGETGVVALAWGRLGQAYLAYGLEAAARVALTNAAGLEPANGEWWHSLGLLELGAGDFDAAAQAFRYARAADPGSAASILRLGQVLLDGGDFEAAREVYGSVAGSEAVRAAAAAGQGRAELALGDTESAARHLEQALELAPRAGALRGLLAQAYRRLGDEDRARSHLRRGSSGEIVLPDPVEERIEAMRVTAAARTLQAGSELLAGETEAAIASYREAVQAAPGDAGRRRDLALALLQTGDAEAALEAMRAAVAMRPESALFHSDLASIESASGRLADATRSYRRAIDLDPGFAAAHFNFANTLIAQSLWRQAQPSLDRVLELNPRQRQARYLKAISWAELGQRRRALEELDVLLDSNPRFGAALISKAALTAEEGDVQEALRLFQQAATVAAQSADRARAHAAAADLLRRQNRAEEALAELRAARREPGVADAVLLELAELLESRGDFAAAAAALADLRSRRPEDTQVVLREAMAWVRSGQQPMALRTLESAYASAPQDRTVANLLARLLAAASERDLRDGERAVRLAEGLAAADRAADVLETLAMAYAEVGRWDEAIAIQEELLASVRGGAQPALADRLRLNLERYRSRLPARL